MALPANAGILLRSALKIRDIRSASRIFEARRHCFELRAFKERTIVLRVEDSSVQILPLLAKSLLPSPFFCK